MNEMQVPLFDQRLDEHLKKNKRCLVHSLVMNHNPARALR
jgi:hypothetical protein